MSKIKYDKIFFSVLAKVESRKKLKVGATKSKYQVDNIVFQIFTTNTNTETNKKQEETESIAKFLRAGKS